MNVARSDQIPYSTQPDSRTVMCNDCGIHERWGCVECAEHWADYHRNEFGHNVSVFLPRRDRDMRPLDTLRVTQRSWWER